MLTVWILAAVLSGNNSTVAISRAPDMGVFATRDRCETVASVMRELGSDSPGVRTECLEYRVGK